MISVEDYEKLGSFYLGKKYDLENRQLRDELVNYDSKDLVTHALCVGMTGSGKTGLCLSLLEEAAIDQIPIICVDPKGDLGNLLLAFPDLASTDFEPWIEKAEETRQGKPLATIAEEMASRWRKGLTDWHQPIERIRKFKESVDVTIYTPGSNVGVPLTVLKSFDAPPQCVIDDAETYRERISSSASGILALLGVEADPLTSREHILLSNILDTAWRAGNDLSIEELIRQLQSPPIKKIGVVDLESFFPAAERMKLSMTLNNLLASPAFAGWLEGQPLEIKDLMYTKEGKPKLSIISISHLNDSERMFFVTILLGELLTWMRAQPGTSSLRALFYMDEVYGYFPPSAKPPSKPPMLTLLKQARAFGLGIVLATQNPMDLDYKGLANMGTWFLGRLQTQRDKDRVLDGLEGASMQQGAAFDRSAMERSLSALGNRVFLMNNVHDDGPTIFQTRWALSFLRGPLSREQISGLMKDRRSTSTTASGKPVAAKSGAAKESASGRPIVRSEINERFLSPTIIPKATSKLQYRPAILAQGSIHFVKATASVDHWQDIHYLSLVDDPVPQEVWGDSIEFHPDEVALTTQPDDGYLFAELPAEMSSPKSFAAWEKAFNDYVFRHVQCTVYQSKALKQTTAPGLSEMDARIELSHAAKEARDEAVETLKQKYADKLRTLQSKITAAELKVEKEKETAKSKKLEGLLNVGTSILGAFLGNKISSRTKVTQAASAVKNIGKVTTSTGNLARAEQSYEELVMAKDEMEQELQAEIETLSERFSVENLALEAIDIPLRKADTKIKLVALAWVPYQITPDGIATPLIKLKQS
jgi:hypothetical protein